MQQRATLRETSLCPTNIIGHFLRGGSLNPRKIQVQVVLLLKGHFRDRCLEPCFKGIWVSDFPYVLGMDKP